MTTRTARFCRALGLELELETDHGSGQLRNGDGPYVFVAELPEGEDLGVQLVPRVADDAAFEVDPALEVVSGFDDTHDGTREMVVRDPDGRTWSLQAPASPDPAAASWRDLRRHGHGHGLHGAATATANLCVRLGTSRCDRLIGSDGVDVLLGRQGDDVRIGGAGHDVLCGDRGRDVLIGGAGGDLLSGGHGTDVALDLQAADGDTTGGSTP